MCKRVSDLENEIYRVQFRRSRCISNGLEGVGVFLTKFGHKLLLSLSAQPDYM